MRRGAPPTRLPARDFLCGRASLWSPGAVAFALTTPTPPPPRPDVSVAPRMRGRRPCHSNRSVNGSNGNGGSLQCRGGRRARRGGGRPGGCSGGRGLGERLSGGVPGTRRRQLGEGGEGTTTGACSGREGGRGGRLAGPLRWRGEARRKGARGCASGVPSGLPPSGPRGAGCGSAEPSPSRSGLPPSWSLAPSSLGRVQAGQKAAQCSGRWLRRGCGGAVWPVK